MNISYDMLGDQVSAALNEFVEENPTNRAMAFITMDTNNKQHCYINGANGMESLLKLCLAHLVARTAVEVDNPTEFLAETFLTSTQILYDLRHGNGDDEEFIEYEEEEE